MDKLRSGLSKRLWHRTFLNTFSDNLHTRMRPDLIKRPARHELNITIVFMSYKDAKHAS